MAPVDQTELQQFCGKFPSLNICSQKSEVTDQQILKLLKSYLRQDNALEQVLYILALVVVIVAGLSTVWCICEFYRFVQRSRPHVPAQTSCMSRWWVFFLHKLQTCCICLWCHGQVMDMAGNHVEN